MNDLQVLAPTASEVLELVTHAEYCRLLGWPPSRPMDEAMAMRVDGSLQWYAQHGAPWVAARRLAVRKIEADEVTLGNGERLSGASVAAVIASHSSPAVVVAAITAGADVSRVAQAHWTDGRPDEGWFLDRLGAAVAEALTRWATVALCRRAAHAGETLLMHHSPGCGGWPLENQFVAWRALCGGDERSLGPVQLLDSGGLEPAHALLAVYPITLEVVATPDAREACRRCDLVSCRFRRAAYVERA